LFNHVVKGTPHPYVIDFCLDLLKNEITIVKLELASGSVIRSVKDQVERS
jgi:hypothetical protein